MDPSPSTPPTRAPIASQPSSPLYYDDDVSKSLLHGNGLLLRGSSVSAGSASSSSTLGSVDGANCFPRCSPVFYIPRRLLVVLFAFLCTLVVYLLRVAMSVCIVTMADATVHDWSNTLQGFISAAFFYGYVLTQLVGAHLSNKYGAKQVLGIGALIASLMTALTPIASYSLPALFIVRVLTGVAEGVTYPSIHHLFSKWIPQKEVSRSVGVAWSGAQLGTAITMGITPSIISALGWEAPFYIFAGVGVLWYIGWYFLIASTPSEHPSIHPAELGYILKHLEPSPDAAGAKPPAQTKIQSGKHGYSIVPAVQDSSLEDDHGQDAGVENPSIQAPSSSMRAIPWKIILSQSPVWALICANFCINWSYYTLLTFLPNYLNHVIGYDLEKSGFAGIAPYLAMFVMSLVSGRFADFLLHTVGVRTILVRKGAIFIGCIFPGALLSGMGYLDDQYQILGCIIAAVGLSGFNIPGYGPSPLDLAPDFAGALIALSNTAGTVPGMIAPSITGVLLDSYGCTDKYPEPNSCHTGWKIVFFIAAGVYVVGTVVWLTLASATPIEALKPQALERERLVQEGKQQRSGLSGYDSTGFLRRREFSEA